MKKIAVFFVAFALGIGALVGAASVAPAGVSEAVAKIKPPSTMDECMCGGTVTFQFDHKQMYGSDTYCFYRKYVNGYHQSNVITIYPNQNVNCPPQPNF